MRLSQNDKRKYYLAYQVPVKGGSSIQQKGHANVLVMAIFLERQRIKQTLGTREILIVLIHSLN